MKDNKINFYFPSTVLKSEDFSPIESSMIKDYYRNSFLKLIDKVSKIYLIIILIIFIIVDGN